MKRALSADAVLMREYSQHLRIASISGALVAGFWLPMRMIGFAPQLPFEIIFDCAISMVACVNVCLAFMDSGRSPRHWAGWLRPSVLLDLFCVIPIFVWSQFLNESAVTVALVFNLLSARHIRNVRPFLDDFDSLQPVTYRLVPLLVGLPVLVHLTACGWIALGSGTALKSSDNILTYVKAIYWAFTTLTTVGYGDISANSIPQMLYACGAQVVGVGVFGYIVSNVAGILARSDAAREHHMDNLDKIENYIRMHRIPNELRAKIRTYYHYMWINKKGYQDKTVLKDLPMTIQSELLLHINKPIIEKVPFLRGADPELLTRLMAQLKPRVYIPDECVFKIDDHGDALYFIQSGTIEVLARDGSVIATLGEGAFFGEMALISDRTRNAAARASSYCDLYVLQKEAFNHVVESSPTFRHHIEQIISERKAA